MKLSLDFHPGHDSHAKTAPVEWLHSKLNILTTPEDWEYKGWGIYKCRVDIPEENWTKLKDLYKNGSFGQVRGASKC